MAKKSADSFACLDNYNGMLIDRCRVSGRHRTYVIDLADERAAVVKCFGRRTSWLNTQLRALTNFFSGRSSIYVKKRYATERRIMRLWQSHGFDTFTEITDLPPDLQGRCWLVTKFADGMRLDHYLAQQDIGQGEKDAVMRRFWEQTARRHRLALNLCERGLLQGNPSLKHIMLLKDGQMLTFDFEVAFVRFVSVKTLIGRELVGYVRSMAEVLNSAQLNHCVKAMVQSYPETTLLDLAKRVKGSKAKYAQLLLKTKEEVQCEQR